MKKFFLFSILFGSCLVLLQIFICCGYVEFEVNLGLTFNELNSLFGTNLIWFISYFLFGILGILILILGLIGYDQRPKNKPHNDSNVFPSQEKSEFTDFKNEAKLDDIPQSNITHIEGETLVFTEFQEPIKHKNKHAKRNFCSICGGKIDQNTKRCSHCGKQYFKGFKVTKFSVAIFICILLVAIVSMLSVQIYNLNDEIDYLKRQINNNKTIISRLENSNAKYYSEVYFWDEHAVLVNSNSSLYHKYGCDDFDSSYFYIYNTEYAIALGYSPCSKCH